MKKFTTGFIIVLAAIAIATQGVSIYISNTYAADSIVATNLNSKIESTLEENVDLQSKILDRASFRAVASRAAELGYKSEKTFVSVYDPVPLAYTR